MSKSTQEILDENKALKEQVELLSKELQSVNQLVNKASSEAYRYKSAFGLLVKEITKSDTAF